MLTIDVNEEEILDLTGCGLEVNAVLTDLAFVGIPARVHASDERHPQRVLSRVRPEAIRAAGYRVVRLREWIDWGAGERHAESVYIVDPTALIDREVLPLSDRNYQFPNSDGKKPALGAGLVCPQCQKSRGDVVAVNENHISFRCEGCGYRWSAGEPGALTTS